MTFRSGCHGNCNCFQLPVCSGWSPSNEHCVEIASVILIDKVTECQFVNFSNLAWIITCCTFSRSCSAVSRRTVDVCLHYSGHHWEVSTAMLIVDEWWQTKVFTNVVFDEYIGVNINAFGREIALFKHHPSRFPIFQLKCPAFFAHFVLLVQCIYLSYSVCLSTRTPTQPGLKICRVIVALAKSV